MNPWKDRSVLETRGARFIGSYLTSGLAGYEAGATTADNSERRRKESLGKVLDRISFPL